ncbi:helix-turn-helix domain-containing protein [Cellulomonas sp. Leaf334]|uniref:helix-turn-helix domain-containing protein n=1 Tax=Cellulomonas sp. Leaf334 TaxID=1736339 RepID=UPI0006FE4546|nr:helix-turn-helix transcriptional regulator [Cellulomonas sp. Leaf334]KQR17262.1 hypothetical protein ASF78_08180 [Cellulomonas sp. Leaf334]
MPDPDRQLAQRQAFGARLRALRAKAELSQEELAHAADLDRTYVNAVENGRRNLSLHAMWQFADALSVTPEAFFRVDLATAAES